LFRPRGARPPGWSVEFALEGVQMVAPDFAGAPYAGALELGAADGDEMLALVERTKPGPFLARTHEMGRYVGWRDGGRLVAMAGERLRTEGLTELSAVCTDEEYRGRGLAAGLVGDVVHGIRARRDVPILHAAASNTGAIRLYEALGFRVHQTIDPVLVRAPVTGS
jgi:ribosomal protein S18 acetylase RimI-like enzyme